MSRLPAILLGPAVLAQASALRKATPLLDPPPEPWEGVTGPGQPSRRVLLLGDSTAIGTGVQRASDSLGARIAARLADDDGAVAWRAIGHNGDTAAQTRRDFLPAALEDAAEVAVVLVGWNDAMHLRSPRAFRSDLEALVRALAARRPAAPGNPGAPAPPAWRVLVVAPPHFEKLPVLRQPLRLALGSAARGLRRESLRVCAAEGATLVPGFDGRSTASDGFHPDAAGYERMAASVVAALRGPG